MSWSEDFYSFLFMVNLCDVYVYAKRTITDSRTDIILQLHFQTNARYTS